LLGLFSVCCLPWPLVCSSIFYYRLFSCFAHLLLLRLLFYYWLFFLPLLLLRLFFLYCNLKFAYLSFPDEIKFFL
jgi:hypothetical protein